MYLVFMRKLPSLMNSRLEGGSSGGVKQALQERTAGHVILRRDRADLRLQAVEHGIDVLADLRLIGIVQPTVLHPLGRVLVDRAAAALGNWLPAKQQASTSTPLTGSIWLVVRPRGAGAGHAGEFFRRETRTAFLLAFRAADVAHLPEGLHALNIVTQLVALGLVMLMAAALVARLYCPAALMTCDMPCKAAPWAVCPPPP